MANPNRPALVKAQKKLNKSVLPTNRSAGMPELAAKKSIKIFGGNPQKMSKSVPKRYNQSVADHNKTVDTVNSKLQQNNSDLQYSHLDMLPLNVRQFNEYR